ncbi:hypothetical protein [Streptomyces sp. NPDC006368]|uniref:hypothetical protein n=1 Tax=Streptomyces sp. NPDC006368 TaxID=3156760 RepID=UPI0033BB7E67
MAFLLAPWPVAHAVFLVLDVYTVLFVLGLHAASATRPHLLTGAVPRLRQAGHVELRVRWSGSRPCGMSRCSPTRCGTGC